MFDTLIVLLEEFLESVNFEKMSRQQKNIKNFPACKELTNFNP